MSVELIAVGTELVALGRRDTNSEWLAEQLNRRGLEVVARCAVDDDVERIASTVRSALERSETVVVTGGLGPTEDDRTRDALARVLNTDLERDERRVRELRALYERHGRSLSETAVRQALRPRGTLWIDNPLGSAAGLRVERKGRLLFALPGVPGEMRAMFLSAVLPRLRRGRPACSRRTFRIAGRTEASVDRQLRDLYELPGIEVTLLSSGGELELHVRARDATDGSAGLAAFDEGVRSRLGLDLFGFDDDSLASVVGRSLRERGRTLASAESCTAGLLGATITTVPGASAWYRGGLVVYANELKTTLAGVRPETLARHGAVSPEVARELAGGARIHCAADVGLGITGVAGPGGASPGKPVGLVHVALDDGHEPEDWELRLPGDRQGVRRLAVTVALDRLRRRLLATA